MDSMGGLATSNQREMIFVARKCVYEAQVFVRNVKILKIAVSKIANSEILGGSGGRDQSI